MDFPLYLKCYVDIKEETVKSDLSGGIMKYQRDINQYLEMYPKLLK